MDVDSGSWKDQLPLQTEGFPPRPCFAPGRVTFFHLRRTSAPVPNFPPPSSLELVKSPFRSRVLYTGDFLTFDLRREFLGQRPVP